MKLQIPVEIINFTNIVLSMQLFSDLFSAWLVNLTCLVTCFIIIKRRRRRRRRTTTTTTTKIFAIIIITI